MKKTATKISGILTLVFSILLILISLLIICERFNIANVSSLVGDLVFLQLPLFYFSYIFIALPSSLIASLTSLELRTIEVVFISLFFTFSVFMAFWGIKEILISRRDDVDFARCKKTCGFMFFTKFMFFFYTLFILVASFLIEEVKLVSAVLEVIIKSLLGIDYGFLIITALILLLSLLLFLLPIINVSKVAKKVKQDSINNKKAGESLLNGNAENVPGETEQELDQFYKIAPKPTMQANMPPLPNYKPAPNAYSQQNSNASQNNLTNNASQTTNQGNQAVQQDLTANNQNNVQNVLANGQTTTQTAPNSQLNNNIQNAPLQQGQQTVTENTNNPNNLQNTNLSIPSNNLNTNVSSVQQNEQVNISSSTSNSNGALSEKAKADLDRLERLKAMGAVTPENYEAMKKKILENN